MRYFRYLQQPHHEGSSLMFEKGFSKGKSGTSCGCLFRLMVKKANQFFVPSYLLDSAAQACCKPETLY